MVAAALCCCQSAYAQRSVQDRQIGALDSRLSDVEGKIRRLEPAVEQAKEIGPVLLLYAAVCALWAQNTNRNAWLWFCLGLFFSVITVFVMLWKNAKDRRVHQEATD
jgi:hypothetical protein